MLAYVLALRQSLLFRDPLIKYGYLIGALFNFASWALLLWFDLFRLGEQKFAALHTTIYFGIDLVGPAYKLFFYPLIGLIIFLVNAGMAGKWGKRDVFLARSSAWITAFLELALFLASLFVVLLNLQ
ncbi:hypothetical protein HYT45_01690 [Candidatus Uhrbacteria bacterium]|nr:hypothetical protein [Candidatus Uhrbacteria bacterium]